MKQKVALFIFVPVLLWIICSPVLVSFEEKARHFYEEDRFCESLPILSWTSYLSKYSKRLLARIHSCGYCSKQDLSVAKKLYKESGINSKELPRILFYDAIEIGYAASRGSIEVNNFADKISNIFSESKSLGYSPGEEEMKLLTELGIKRMY